MLLLVQLPHLNTHTKKPPTKNKSTHYTHHISNSLSKHRIGMNRSGEGLVWKRSRRREMEEKKELFSKREKQGKRKKASLRTKRPELVSYEELPEYMKDNEYILNYYRAEWTLKEAFFSVFRLHNESLNVWTHLIGLVIFVGLTIANLTHVSQVAEFLNIFTWSFPSNTGANMSHYARDIFSETTKIIDLKHNGPLEMDITSPEMASTQWPFFVFLGGSMFCLLSSSVCHLFSCHSHHLNLLLLQVDYAGITVMIITSFFPPIYYIFQCDPHWQLIYLGGITIMGIFTIMTLLSPIFSTGKFRAFRASLFVAMGLFGIIPAVHAVIVNWTAPQRNVTLAYEAVMALSYLTGTVFYVCRIPERWKPGMFDLAGHSHQIFHVFVIIGALAHYGAALIFLEFRGRVGSERI